MVMGLDVHSVGVWGPLVPGHASELEPHSGGHSGDRDLRNKKQYFSRCTLAAPARRPRATAQRRCAAGWEIPGWGTGGQSRAAIGRAGLSAL